MNNYIALLRGINVSGQKKVPMATLRQLLHNNGLKDVQTYIQSGNLVFKADLNKPVLADLIGETIKTYFGFEVPTLVLTAKDLSEILEQNPFKDKDISKLHLTFLNSTPDMQLVEMLPQSPNPREEFLFAKSAIYVYCPDGYGRTKINNNFFESKLKVTATTRNWKTCLKLLEMGRSI